MVPFTLSNSQVLFIVILAFGFLIVSSFGTPPAGAFRIKSKASPSDNPLCLEIRGQMCWAGISDSSPKFPTVVLSGCSTKPGNLRQEFFLEDAGSGRLFIRLWNERLAGPQIKLGRKRGAAPQNLITHGLCDLGALTDEDDYAWTITEVSADPQEYKLELTTTAGTDSNAAGVQYLAAFSDPTTERTGTAVIGDVVKLAATAGFASNPNQLWIPDTNNVNTVVPG